ncbi:site-specific integrase [Vibrio splendidus]|uniref:site-specific integrase n=1 Tax=Vibrio splendidus TaxID=29497 RepID=UPI0027323CF1|nr:site-specific integrase [Vibrio splendidus]MDP2588239.1 site-specific integrase [Vibrio splendidus]
MDSFIILYINPVGAINPIVFRELLAYFEQNGGYGLSWQRQVARAVGLFYDFCVEKAPAYKNDNNVSDAIRGFVQCSLNGDERLGWLPTKAKTVKRNLACIMEFSTFLEANGVLPKNIKGTPKHYFYRASAIKSNVLLSHVTDVSKLAKRLSANSYEHIYKFRKDTDVTSVPLSTFPEELIEPLLNEGFKLNDGSENIGAKMLTILLIFGGMRNSEPFHLWFNDFNIFPKSGNLEILLHHPSDSTCNIPPYKGKTRYHYLLERGLLPRTDKRNTNSYYAGWKDLALDSNYTTDIRIIHKDVEQFFIRLYKEYMRQRESYVAIYRANHGHDHPFFFVKTGDPADLGAPLSMKSYISSLKRATKRLKKLGYESAEYGFKYGISPHPMRHWFATILEESGVKPKILQDLMNHRNILSQEVYKSATKRAIDEAINNVANNYRISINNGCVDEHK